MRIGLAPLALAIITGSMSAAQQPSGSPTQGNAPVTFRVETNYVEVDALVTDDAGRPATDLTLADFEILEDGRPQKIETLAVVRHPLESVRPAAGTVPDTPDVAANTSTDGRIYLILLDDLHTTLAQTPRVKAFLREFVDTRLGPTDLAAVAYTSGRVAGAQEFTSNRELLLEAIDKFAGRRLRSEALEIAEALARDPRDATDTPLNPASRAGDWRDPFDPYSRLNPFEAERAQQARTTLTVLRDLAALMESVRGRRKSMLFVSEGLTYNVFDGFRNTSAGAILREATDAMAAAMRANVAVYAIDPRGVATAGDAIGISGTSPNDPHFSVPGAMQDLLRISQGSLRDISAQTGGFAGVDSNDFAGLFDRIVRENSTYYLLGYHSTNERRDGRFREIRVRVRRAGLQVRARRGYIAPRDGRDAAELTPVNAALSSPVPVTGIPIAVTAAPFVGDSSDASVALAIEMRADAFRLVERGDRFTDRVHVSVSATDDSGNVRRGRQHTLDLELRAANAALARERGLRVLSEVTLPPGRYHLRVAVAEDGAGRTGSVFHDITVPDFRAPGFHMSGVALTSAAASETPTVRAIDPLARLLASPATTARDFSRDDAVAVAAEFYENGVAASHMVELSATMKAVDGRTVFDHRTKQASAGANSRYPLAVQIPLDQFPPGRYVIRIEGRSRAGGSTAARDVWIGLR